MFIFQHISSFISLIHPLSAVFISEETECRTFVIENKSISFSIFNYQFLIIETKYFFTIYKGSENQLTIK